MGRSTLADAAVERFAEALDGCERAGLRRYPHVRQRDDTVIDLAGNDYLGLARDRRVVAAAVEALTEWGAGSTGSRLVTGTVQAHEDLERDLAEFTGAAASLVFSSGYLANIGALGVLGGPGVTVLSDAANHASLIDGCRLSRSEVVVFPSDSPAALAVALAGVRTPHAVVAVDGVYSATGRVAPVGEIHALTRRHGAMLLVDEAHALGVVGPDGRGTVAAAGLAAEPDVVRTVTLSKALGSQGGAVLGDRRIIDLMFSTARTMIFDTGLAPPSVAAARTALAVLRTEPERVTAVRRTAAAIHRAVEDLGVETVTPEAAVVPAVIGDPQLAVSAAARSRELGVQVGCFRPPAVPPGRSCLRLTARADLTTDDLTRVREVLRTVLQNPRHAANGA